MFKPWEWITRSNERALANARGACTELNRRRVERNEIEDFVAQLVAARGVAATPALAPTADLRLTLG